MRSARLALVIAVVASTLLVASPAQARHTCGLDDPTLNSICESHVEQSKLFRKIVCLVFGACY